VLPILGYVFLVKVYFLAAVVAVIEPPVLFPPGCAIEAVPDNAKEKLQIICWF
jgi:hypothetical protein